MSITTPSALRQAFATRIALLSGWGEAKVPYDQFGTSGVPDGVSMPRGKAKLFVVGLGSSLDGGGRQSWGEGVEYKTEVGVKFLRSLPAKNKLAGVDAAHDDEVELQGQLLELAWPGAAFGVRWLSTSRNTLTGGDHVLIEHRYATDHLVNN